MHSNDGCSCFITLFMLFLYIGGNWWMYKDSIYRGRSINEASIWVLMGILFPVCVLPVYLIARQATSPISSSSLGEDSASRIISSVKKTFLGTENLPHFDVKEGSRSVERRVERKVVEKVTPIIEKAAPPAYRAAPVSTPAKAYGTLLDAVRNNALEQVKNLLVKGAEVNGQDDKGVTPLHMAAGKNFAEVVDSLITGGADVKSEDYDGRTPLHWAAIGGRRAIIVKLLAHFADINAKDYDGKTPLHEAAGRGLVETVTLLISRGADMNVKDYEGKTPLDAAIASGDDKTIRLLHSHGAKEGTSV